ncbi:MAG: hypothetical protein IKA74_02275 [Clostridia bacterium]|nr:hypothetical protein [Clostridia bacterium]
MNTYVIDDLVSEILACVERHKLNTRGAYARWLWGNDRNLGINEYGCADAANILYTIGYFPKDPEERAAQLSVLQSFQDPVSGLFSEPTHHPIHTTAHCSASIELFDAKPLYKCHALEKYTQKEGLYELLEQEIDWQNPWPQSHKGAGILPALTNTDMVGLEWKNWYFDWMWEHSDSETGFIYFSKNGQKKKAPLFEYMAGGFHYFFDHEAEHRPMRYPERVIDSCLKIMEGGPKNPMCDILISFCGFIEIDVVYCLTRAMRQTPYRFHEAKKALEIFAEQYLAMMYDIEYKTHETFNDLHSLFGAVCCLAELQSALPGKILTSRPLKLVLDRRPFI